MKTLAFTVERGAATLRWALGRCGYEPLKQHAQTVWARVPESTSVEQAVREKVVARREEAVTSFSHPADGRRGKKRRHNMRVEFTTVQYVFSHGKEPRGRGSWAFEFPGDATPWFTPGNTLYKEAKELAKAEAARRFNGTGYVRVKVLP